MSASGKMLWYYFDHSSNSTNARAVRGGTSVLYKEGKVYFYLQVGQEMMDVNGNALGISTLSSYQGGIIELDSTGTLQNEFLLNSSGYALEQYQTPDPSTIVLTKVHLTAPNMSWLDNGDISVFGSTSSGTLAGTYINANVPPYSKVNFRVELNPTTGTWSTPQTFYGGRPNNDNALLSVDGHNGSYYNITNLAYGWGEQVISGTQPIDLTRFDNNEYGSFVRAFSSNGSILWTKELINFEASAIDFDKTNNQLIVFGKHKGTAGGEMGFKASGTYDLGILVLNASSGEFTAAETISCPNNVKAYDAYLSDCGNYHVVGRNEIFSDTITALKLRNQELKVRGAQTFFIKLPVSSLTCSDNCTLITGENETPETVIKIKPNPSSGSFTISGLQPEFGEISIESLEGKMITSITFYGENEIPVSLNASPGIYLIQVRQNGRVQTRKIVLQ